MKIWYTFVTLLAIAFVVLSSGCEPQGGTDPCQPSGCTVPTSAPR